MPCIGMAGRAESHNGHRRTATAKRDILRNWAGIGVEWNKHLLDDVVYAFTVTFEAESEGCNGGWLSHCWT